LGGIRAFLVELRRRHVFRVAAWYAVASWIVIQVAVSTFPSLLLPDWAVRLVIVLCLVGLPIALVLAWAYELTPEGVRPATQMPQALENRWFGTSTALALAAGVLLGVGATQGWLAIVEPTSQELGIAVMPFENRSADPEDAYFADGVHEELLRRLAMLHGVRVISRTSVVAYRGLNKSAKEIGRELDVTHVLEGSVRRSAGRFVLTAQLVDARVDAHLWSKDYEGEESEVFAAQRDVADRIVAELNVRLTGLEGDAASRVPTQVGEAYSLYLRGKQILESTEEVETKAQRCRPFFEAAIARDSGFALAHAALSIAFSNDAWQSGKADLGVPAEHHARRAMTLEPNLSESNLATGYVLYYIKRDYPAAEASFRRALVLAPNASAVHIGLAQITNRQGRKNEASAWYESAVRLSPRDISLLNTASRYFASVRRWKEAIALLDRAVALAPEDVGLAYVRAVFLWRGLGDLAALQALFEQHPERIAQDPAWFRQYLYFLMGQDRVADALAMLETHAFEAIEPSYWFKVERPVMQALLQRALGKSDGDAFRDFVSARRKVYLSGDVQDRDRLALAATMAYSGHLDDAAALVDIYERTLESLGDQESNERRRIAAVRVVIQAQRGEHDAAIVGLRGILASSQLTVHDLRAVKYYFPTLRDDPRLQSLLRGEET
jgi:TolB-like protein